MSTSMLGIEEDLRFLGCFPARASLTFRGPGRWGLMNFTLPALSGNLRFPKLNLLHAPCKLLPLFLGSRPRTSVVEPDHPDSCPVGLLDPAETAGSVVYTPGGLSRLAIARRALRFALGVLGLWSPDPVLDMSAVLWSMPDRRLIQLCVVTFPTFLLLIPGKPLKYFTALPTAIPSFCQPLVLLLIIWEFEYDADVDDVWPGPDASKAHLINIQSALLERCPGLNNLTLDGEMFAYRWHPARGGEFRPYM
ncbi:hypothetical protein C8F01DRAFT_1257542 [Mycena amicta]|nr:hypothetical protein C8F01DRAFT_1257542 [Mycena amicta]